ncbi:hypothetical protein F5B17DRAFT_434244 [Nemania serpens]|nr:hypothetical protein F5B17DRAFT_434244 [Nemania serpens]
MYGSRILATILGASAVFAAPTWPQVNSELARSFGQDVVSEYFNLLAQKTSAVKHQASALVCDVSKAHMPTLSASPLPVPLAGLVVKHVAIGRGTQNYTCDTSNATAVPVANGAVATLFNASCVASTYPDILHMLPRLALSFDLPASLAASTSSSSAKLGPTDLLVSGRHFFTNVTTPFFNLDTDRYRIGEAPCSKLNASGPPADAPKGRKGENAVPWLRLAANPGATGGIQEVYRVETAGGSAPATCAGQPAAFQVQYAAE